MTILNDETVAISTFAELKSTIETNNTIKPNLSRCEY